MDGTTGFDWILLRPTSTSWERPMFEAETFVQRALDALGRTAEELAGRGKRQEVVRAREILMTLGAEGFAAWLRRIWASSGSVSGHRRAAVLAEF